MTPNVNLVAWRPDADPTVPGVFVDLEQLLPTQRGYAPERGLAVPSSAPTALPSACLGANLVQYASLSSLTLAGTDTGLYTWWGGSQLDLTRSGTAYTAAQFTVYPWVFAAFGDVTLAAQQQNTLQATTNPHGGTKFSDVSGGPKAATMCISNNFVMLGNTGSDSSWPYGDGYWCSAREDHTDWTPDVATQCERGRLLQTPGQIVRMIAYRNFVLAFKGNSFLRGSYVNDVQRGIWRWEPISTSVGLAGANAICDAEGVLYWAGPNGFYRFAGGAEQRITSAPWEWLMRNISDPIYAGYMQAQWDPVRRLVRWYYPSDATDPIVINAGIAYHPETDRWGRFAHDIEFAVGFPTDDAYRPTSTTAGAYLELPAVINTSHTPQLLNGSTVQDSSITTGDVGDDDRVIVGVRARLRFLSAPSSSSLTHYHRAVLSDALTAGTTASRNDGKYDFTYSARWHRLRVENVGNYELLGMSFGASGAGTR